MDELKEVIKGKFEFLKKYSNSAFNKTNLREVSSLLRFLFIDNGGAINKIKNDLNLEDIKIELNNNLFEKDLDGLMFYQHGGGNKNGEIQIQGIKFINKALTAEEIKNMYEKEKKKMEEKIFLTLGKYFQTTSFIFDGIKIDKEFVIKFVANKLGGNHYDEERKHKKENEKNKMLVMDKIMVQYEILGENPIFIELMSIGQLLSNDKNLNNFINKL